MRSLSAHLGSQTFALLAVTILTLFDGPKSHADGGATTNSAACFYSADPNHIWNRLHRALFVRTAPDGKEYGADQLDPLLWANTKFLLEGSSHERAVNALDEFLAKHAEKLINDRLKRAILQRDLWAVFDWSANHWDAGNEVRRRELQKRLVQVIKRVALSAEEIKTLPDNYSEAIASKKFASNYFADRSDEPFLPPDLFQRDGQWVCVGANGSDPVAPTHVRAFDGRSVFLVFLSLPGGHQATIDYLNKLRIFPNPWIPNSSASDPNRFLPNPDLPQFPVGTQVALVRQSILIDSDGNLVPARLTESVQLRVYRAIPKAKGSDVRMVNATGSQDVYEFKLSRPKLFAHEAGGLRAIGKDERDIVFVQMQSFGVDPFEFSEEERKRWGPPMFIEVVLNTCMSCHSAPGIHSLNSRAQLFERKTLRPPELADLSPDREQLFTMIWKQRHYTWGLLQGLWATEDPR